jgi:hypothetical protein
MVVCNDSTGALLSVYWTIVKDNSRGRHQPASFCEVYTIGA